MIDKPRPCPGCGSDDIIRPYWTDWNGHTYLGGDATTECRQCGFRADIEAWQRRTPGPATASVCDLIRSCLEVAGVAEVIIGEETARAFLAEHELYP